MAKKEGKFKGRLTRYTESHEGLRYALDLYDGGEMTVKKICAITNVSKSTLYRVLDKRKIKNRTIRTKCCDCSNSYWEFLYGWFVDPYLK